MTKDEKERFEKIEADLWGNGKPGMKEDLTVVKTTLSVGIKWIKFIGIVVSATFLPVAGFFLIKIFEVIR